MKISDKDTHEVFGSDESQCLATMRAYIENGGSKNVIDEKSGWSLLHFCCEHQQVKTLAFLISVGLNIEVEDQNGWRPIHLAVDSDIDAAEQTGEKLSFSCTRVLMLHGADLDVRNQRGATPRDMAATYGKEVLKAYDAAVRERHNPSLHTDG